MVNLPTHASFSTLNDVFVESQLYFGVSGSTPQLTLDITDIPDGPTIYIGSWGSNSAYPVYNIKNAYHGSAYLSTIKNTPNPGGVDGNPSQRYLVNFLRDVKFHTADISQNSISGVKVYLSGGTIASSQQAWNGTAITGVTALANTTLLTTNSSGDTPVTSINLGSNINSSTAAAINYERTSNDDEFSVSFWSYNHLFGQIPSQSLKGNGQLTVTRTLVDDSHISESTKATVDAYTHIEDLDQLYDRGKSWKIDNISSEYPAIDEQIFDASGTTLELGALNLTLDGTTATPFSVNQTTTRTTIAVSNTLRFGSKFDKITTTGVVTTTNGGSIETGYTDSTGSYTFIELTNLDQQDVLIQSQLSGSAVATLTNVTGLTGTYKILVPAPVAANTSLSITATRDGYAPWTDTVPRNTLTFQRGVSTSLSNSTGINQRFMINLAIKILQKTEALSHVIYHTPDPVPSMNVSITLNNDQTVPTITNQEAMLQILYRILNKTSALREAIQD